MTTAMPNVDLRPDHWAIVKSALQRHVPDREVLVFGSRATWTAKDYSDLDLAIMGDEPLSLHIASALDEALGESDLPFKVDVVDWARIDDDFRAIVVRHGVVVQSAAGSSKGRGVGHPSVHRAEGWRAARLGEVVRFLSGGTPSKKCAAYWNGEIPWVSAKEMKQFRLCDTTAKVTVKALANGAKRVPAGTVLLLTRGMRLLKEVPVCVVQQPMTFNQDIKALESKPDVDPSFLPYLLLGNTERLRNLVDLAGHGTGRINTDELGALDVRLPPVRGQRAIAHVLGTLDDKIELNRRMNETLEAMARALFKSWFVDFDPVRAKMEGRNTGLPQDIADLFPDRLVDSEMGEIPQGWVVMELRDLCHKPQYGYTASAQSEPVGPRFLRITDINKESWVSWSRVPYCEATDDEFSKYRLVKGDVLIARMADPGHGILIEEDVEAVFASYLIRFRPLDRQTTRFLQYWLKSDAYWHLVRSRATGTTRRSLNATVLSSFPLVVPPNAVAGAFAKAAGTWRERVVANVREKELLTALRDALLPKLVSGEIRLTEVEGALVSVT